MLTSAKTWVRKLKKQAPQVQKLPLQIVLIVPFVIQIVVAVGVTGLLSVRNGQEAINNIAAKHRAEVAERLSTELDRYLALPPSLNQTNVDATYLGLLDLKNFYMVGNYFSRQMRLHKVGYINYANPAREYIGVERLNNGQLLINETTVRLGINRMAIFATDSLGNRKRQLKVINVPDVRLEAWYADAVKAKKPIWSQVYQWDDKPNILSISHSYPLYTGNGRLIGVLGVDYVLTQVSDFLHELKVGRSGTTFIMERSGLIVASSSSEAPIVVSKGGAKRVSALESKTPLIRATASYLTKRFGNLRNIKGSQQLDFSFSGSQHFLQVKNWKDKYGLDWLIVVVIPESDFTETIQSNTLTTVLLCFFALALAIAIGVFTSRWIVHPISTMVEVTEAFSKGKWQERVSELGIGEVRLLSQTFNSMAEQLQTSFAQLQHIAYHDLLTGLPNRLAFLNNLETEIARTKQNPHYQFALLLLDLDGFKLVNDSLGHLVGDRLLIAVTERLKECLSESDFVARFGGDEFMILLGKIASSDIASKTAEMIAQALKQPFMLGGHEVFISTSVGIVLSKYGDQSETFIRDADIALYRAKSKGKACYEAFDTVMHTEVALRMRFETDLRRGLDRGEFELYYQPIVDLRSDRISGLEALVRWHHPKEGLISPDLFIPIAEETGMIGRLGEWVFEQSCRQMQQWAVEIPTSKSVIISINVSSHQFLQADLSDRIEQIIVNTGLDRRRLKLEITESVLMDHAELAAGNLARFKQRGIQLTIDDFGIGYSSLSYLHRLPVSTLKIDRSFIKAIGPNKENLELIEVIILLARKLKMNVVAEGVENSEQLEYLRALGCRHIQGYFFSPPLPSNAIARLLSAGKITDGAGWKI